MAEFLEILGFALGTFALSYSVLFPGSQPSLRGGGDTTDE